MHHQSKVGSAELGSRSNLRPDFQIICPMEGTQFLLEFIQPDEAPRAQGNSPGEIGIPGVVVVFDHEPPYVAFDKLDSNNAVLDLLRRQKSLCGKIMFSLAEFVDRLDDLHQIPNADLPGFVTAGHGADFFLGEDFGRVCYGCLQKEAAIVAGCWPRRLPRLVRDAFRFHFFLLLQFPVYPMVIHRFLRTLLDRRRVERAEILSANLPCRPATQEGG